MKLILADTVGLMNSGDYRDRFVAEYIQLKIRHERLNDFNTNIEASVRTRGLDNGVDEPIHDCPAGLLREQQTAMGEYLHLLEVRAKIEDIDLEDAIEYFSDKKRDKARELLDECAVKRELELSVCCDCVHYPICNYCVGRIKYFKLPGEKQSCDFFESVNGCGEERCECEKEEIDVTLE